MKKATRPNYDLKLIGKNLKNLRKRKGLSVEDVCDYLGIESERTIYYYESGERVAPFDVMFALMELYEADLADVIGPDKASLFYSFEKIAELGQSMILLTNYDEILDAQNKTE